MNTPPEHQAQNMVVYSHSNPPPSIEEARRKLDEIDDSLAKIGDKLEIKRPEDFISDRSYRRWERRIICVQGKLEQQRRFLLGWANHKELNQHFEHLRSPQSPHVTTLMRAVDKFLQGNAYTPIYNATNVPTTIEACKERRAAVIELKKHYEHNITTMRTFPEALACQDHQIRSVIARLKVVLYAMDEEILIVNKTLKILRKGGSGETSIIPLPETPTETAHFKGDQMAMIGYLLSITDGLIQNMTWVPEGDMLERYDEIANHHQAAKEQRLV